MSWIIKIILILTLLDVNLTRAQEVNSLSLNDCIKLALKNNASIRKSDLSAEQAHISVKQSYSGLLPSVDVSASASASDNNVQRSDWEAQWSIQKSINQSFYRPGLYSDIQLAKVNENIAHISKKDMETNIRLQVEQVYFQILSSHALISVYEENIRIAAENLGKIKMMYRLGAKTESDVLKTEVQQGDFQALLIAEQENLAQYRRSLNTLMGRSSEIDFEIEIIPPEQTDVPGLTAARAAILENNREYQALQQTYKAQRISLRTAKEAYLPSISGYVNHSISDNWSSGAGVSSNQVGIRASLDLFNGFSKKHNVQKEQVDLETVKIELAEKERQLIEELTNLYTSFQTYTHLIDIREKNVESARRDLELVTARYTVGASTILDQMDAQSSLLQSQSNLVKVKYSRKIVEAQIKQVLGI